MTKTNTELNGIIVVDKPAGMTSHDVVSVVRRKLGIRRVGHAGTLDPLATGVLVILIGKSTKLFDKFEPFDKAYEATLKLGLRTQTADIHGKVLAEKPYGQIAQDQIERVFENFRGEINQTPPMVSAVKINGKRLYKLARDGIVVQRTARKIRVDSLELIDFKSPLLRFHLECSKGTYVRQLAEDIGEALGCGACITQIKRTKVGPFDIQEAVSLEDVHENYIRSWNTVG